MSLCARCGSVDFTYLLDICLSQCQDRQEALSQSQEYDGSLTNYGESEIKHHSDIFEIEKSSKGCDLCKAIFQTYKKTNVRDKEAARKLQIMLRASYGKIKVCYGAREGLLQLCRLDVYMDEDNGEYYPYDCVMEHIFLCSRRNFPKMPN